MAKSDRGSLESSLVLVPLLTLFLIASQISLAVHGRNMEKIAAQDGASSRAISGQFVDSDTYLHIYSPDSHQNLDLIIAHKRKPLLSLIALPFTGSSEKSAIEVSGIAIVENQR